METTMNSGVLAGARAGFWRRFAGAFIDGIVVGIANGILRSLIGYGAGLGLGLVVGAAYFTAFIGAERGQTLGQMALGIRVVGLDNGGSIGYGRAFLRWVVSLISAAVILLGYLWMLWDKEKQCWHDKAANDVVVPVQR
ncbi:MAG TPA: RDD family protein [Gaiellaceae bacterium]